MVRFFDILFSACAIIVLSPLLIPVSIALRLTGEGEVFYVQKRIGKGGQEFKLLKFATMLKNSPSLGSGTITVKDDPRILPLGKYLRKSKVNELPQLINIFVGDMSVIGPRPLTFQAFQSYRRQDQDNIIKVRPGLSGIGSIVFRGEEDILSDSEGSIEFYKDVIAPYKGALETWFVANCTIANYFRAIYVTLVVVLNPRSIVFWKVFPGVPTPPERLKPLLNYPA